MPPGLMETTRHPPRHEEASDAECVAAKSAFIMAAMDATHSAMRLLKVGCIARRAPNPVWVAKLSSQRGFAIPLIDAAILSEA